MRSFSVSFALGCIGGLVMAGITAPIVGEFYFWMPPVVGIVYGTMRAMHDESDVT